MTPVDLILQNCRIVTTKKILDADIAVDDGKITQIARSAHMPRAEKTVDVAGRIVLPGLIDAHVHFRDPGFLKKGDFRSESIAALHGGVTTVMDMPNTKPRTDSLKALKEKRKNAAKKAACDYALYYEITNKNLSTLKEANAFAYKAYLDTDRVLYESVAHAFVELDQKVIVTHAEDFNSISNHEYAANVETHSEVRNAEAEHTSVDRLLELNFGTNQLHVTHTSTPHTVDLVAHSPKDVTCDVTPHHLFLSTNDYKTLGTRAKVNPSLKSENDRRALWSKLAQITAIATDHAPHLLKEKEQPIEKAAPGFPGVETMLPLLANEVNRGKLVWTDIARLCAHGPAEIFGLAQKGEIVVGKDADFVIVDNKEEYALEAENLHSKCTWTPYEGWKVKGRVTQVFLRGECVVKDQEVFSQPGHGEEII